MSVSPAASLAGFLIRKPTLSRLWLGETVYDSNRELELDVPVAAAAVTMYGGDATGPVNRKAQTGTGTLYDRTVHQPL